MTENQQAYQVMGGKHSRVEGGVRVRYRAGDVFIPTNEEIRVFGNKLKPMPMPVEAKPEPVAEDAGEEGKVKRKPVKAEKGKN